MPATRCACSIRAPRRWRRWSQRGGVAATSPRDAATGAETAFACLPSPEVSRAAAFGTGGASGAASLRTYVEMSTIGSVAIKEIAAELTKRNIVTLDAPVSGGPRGARAGTLSTMVAGEHAAFERVKPMFEALARHVFYVGDKPGLGQVTKLANNMISAAGMLAAFEASAMAVKAGVDARTLIDTVNASTGRNSATMDKFPASVLTRSFDYGGKVSTMYKDVSLALEEAKQLEGADVARRERGRDVAHGHGRRPRRRRLHLADPDDREMGRRGGRRQ